MKKWIRYILVFFFLLATLPSLMVSAEETVTSGKLTANSNNIDVTLTIPQRKDESDKITSLRFRLYVAVETGSMDAPVFQFSEEIKSEVKDASAIKMENSDYMVDVIISGTYDKDYPIFKEDQSKIGTLALKPTTSEYKISVHLAGNTAEDTAYVQYVTNLGRETQTVLLGEEEDNRLETVTVENSAANPSTPGGSTGPTTSTTPFIPSAPSTVDTPSDPDDTNKEDNNKPSDSTNPSVTTPAEKDPANPTMPGSSSETLDTTTKPKAEVTSKEGKKRIGFSWDKVDGADGYAIYQYNEKTGKYKLIKTITNPEKTTFNKTMKKGISYSFKVRAFTTAEDGSKTYGKYSPAINITTAPAKVKGLKIKSAGTNKVTLSWKKVKNAKGYQIFSSKKKNGTYTLVKTLKKASALTAAIKQKNNKAYYYKIRAFVKNAEKKRVYGNFCAGKKS